MPYSARFFEALPELKENIKDQGSNRNNGRKDMLHYSLEAKDPETGLCAYTPDELFNISQSSHCR